MQRSHRRLHAAAWTGLAIVLPILLLAAFLERPDPSAIVAPVRLDQPKSPGTGAQP